MEYKMIFCKGCGKEMPLGLSLCPHCGRKNDLKACESCGNPVPVKAGRCSVCGAKNSKGAKVPVIVTVLVVAIAALAALVITKNEEIIDIIKQIIL
ncbi:MAG: hypothetical protein PUB20_06740 [Clostridia bacterium]|nr:hypothetical protein [Clostridia bacterium]